MALALVSVGATWLVTLLFFPIYIEPGNGDINCGRLWRAQPMEEFLRGDCEKAIEHRREELRLPIALTGVGGLAVVVAYRRSHRAER